jgi:glyoxylase-like metal-dependent hydrolase (beta-lactamase superfamily II)
VWLAAAAAFALGSLGPAQPAAAQDEVKREITNIAGDLYRFQNKFHVSVFLVTPEGVIATDPINAAAAEWLEAEIRERFGQEIRYLILSHDHADHSAGGEVFADTATVVAIYPGLSHSNNLIVMHFPAERAVFTVDFISVKRLPYMTLSDAYFPDWMAAIEAVEAIDFDILVPGHGPMGTKQDAADHRAYLEDLYDQVLAAARAGQSLEDMQVSITMDAYKDWGQYDKWRTLNIEGMLNNISLHRRGN